MSDSLIWYSAKISPEVNSCTTWWKEIDDYISQIANLQLEMRIR
jgi:hypothetical protein